MFALPKYCKLFLRHEFTKSSCAALYDCASMLLLLYMRMRVLLPCDADGQCVNACKVFGYVCCKCVLGM